MPSRFTIVFVLSVLAALHAWIGWRLVPALSADGTLQLLCGLYLVLSWFLIPTALLSRNLSSQVWGDRLSWGGMLAMGLFSSLLLLTLVRELVLLVLPLVSSTLVQTELTVWSAQAVVLGALALTLLGFINARRLAAVVDVEVPIRNLPAALQGFTIAQISDIHVGPTIKQHYLRAIVDRVNGLQADVVAITGDLVDGSVQQLADHTAPLAQLRARHGVYFVTGNHEYYSDAVAWVAEVRRLGLTVLMNEHVVLQHDGAPLVLAGVTDYTAHHFDPAQRSDPQAALQNAPADSHVNILLAHQPRSATAASDAGFDLQLSGHTHGGQFFPWNLFVPMQQPYVAGLNKLHDLWIYTSRGTGYWGPPKRFGVSSEITHLRLVTA
jgi:predicted MPP superfamily phosphohydrolase